MTTSDTLGRGFRVLTPDAFLALPAQTSPLGLIRRPVLPPGRDVVAMRVSVPPDSDIPPHGHPKGKAAMIFVLAGELRLGLGTAFDEEALRPVAAGGIAVFRADDPPHFARTGPEGAEFLVIAAPPEAIAPALLGTGQA